MKVLSHGELYDVHMATMEILEGICVKVLELLEDASVIIYEKEMMVLNI